MAVGVRTPYGTHGRRVGLLAPDPYQTRRYKDTFPGSTRIGTPLDFIGGRGDLPCQQPDRCTWWFAPEKEPGMPELGEAEAQVAEQACGTCPLVLQCRLFALRTGQAWGIWGGIRFAHMHPQTRAALLKDTERLLRRQRRTA